MFEPHLFQVHLQLLGDEHGDRRVGALAHLDIGHGQHDLPIAPDADEGVGDKGPSVGRWGITVCERQAQAEHQASAGGRASAQKNLRRERAFAEGDRPAPAASETMSSGVIVRLPVSSIARLA
jgi:hypothetical protein